MTRKCVETETLFVGGKDRCAAVNPPAYEGLQLWEGFADTSVHVGHGRRRIVSADCLGRRWEVDNSAGWVAQGDERTREIGLLSLEQMVHRSFPHT